MFVSLQSDAVTDGHLVACFALSRDPLKQQDAPMFEPADDEGRKFRVVFLACPKVPRVAHVLPGNATVLLILLLSIVFANTAQAQPSDSTASSNTPSQESNVPEPLRTIEGISEYALENGTRVLLFPDASKEVVTVNMTVFVGSRHEGYGEAGMAHLLEHMLFKGTPTHENIPKSLQDRGARFNGTTWVDRTNYYETLPAGDDNLEFALALEADRLVNSYIKGEDLESEMTVVRNEFERGENSPIRVLMERITSAAFDWHNYGKSTIGNRSDIERVPIVNLRRFYRKFYRPDNVLLIVAGNFEPAFALEKIQATFGVLSAPDTPIEETYTVEPPKDGERTVALRRVGDIQLVGAAYHIPAGSHPDYAAVRVLTYILGDEPSGRLYKRLVESELASNVYAFASGFREPGLLMCLTEMPPENSLESARSTMLDVLEQTWESDPITEQEVERARQQILAQRELEAADSDRIAVSLSDWAAQGDWRLYFLYRDAIEKVSVDQVTEVAERYLTRNNRTVGLFIPTDEAERVSVAEAPDLNEMVRDYKGREAAAAGEAFDPDPEAIAKRIERGGLIGGVEFAVLPKQTRGDAVSFMLTLRFGTPETLLPRRGAAELLGLIMQRGTADLTYQELQDEWTRLRTDLQMFTALGLLQIQGKTKEEFLPEVIALLGKVITEPRLDEDELDVVRRQIVTQLGQSKTEPTALAPRAVRKALSPYPSDDIRYVQSIGEEIAMYEGVTIEQIRELHKNFLGNQAGELSLVGNFEQEPSLDAFRAILDGFETDQPYVRIDRPATPSIAGEVSLIETPDKTNAFFYTTQQIALSDETEDYAALLLGNYILGGGSLSSRLADRVRQQEGLSYGIRSGLTARSKDERVDFTVYAITNPGNKDRLLTAIREEIDRLLAEGVTADELEQAKTAYLQAERVSRTNDGTLAGMLISQMFNDRAMASVSEHEARIRAASVEDVNKALRKYIQPDELVMAVAGDFAKEAVGTP
ncbi:MAG: pitrilysin family protein [Planctomycetota bacterium]